MNAPLATVDEAQRWRLAHYEAARAALALCASIDEVSAIRDRTIALATYARQRDDNEMLVYVQEIKLRASIRIGELVRDLDRYRPAPKDNRRGGPTSAKDAAIAEAGMRRDLAYDCQALAGPRDKNLAAAGQAAAELYFARAREAQDPATDKGLRAAIEKAVHAAMGPEAIRAAAKDLRKGDQAVKGERRAEREAHLGVRTRAAAAALGERRYGVILADPEWDFSVWSPETGMDRSAANHYPTSPLAALQARAVSSIAADHCVLALWATVPMLIEAICVMDAWGFVRLDRDPETGFLAINKAVARYVSSGAWVKRKPGSGIGMGYWFRVDHEVLLLATRGRPPAPAGEDRVRSVFDVPASRVHSQKPELVCEILETYFPNLPKIELNRRGAARPGWDAWGNEAEGASG